MAKLIDQIDSSGLFAQSAYSAAIATNDDLGRKISDTYLTAVDLSPYATTAQVDTVSSLLSAGLDYVSANGGKTYSGVAPIQVNNEENLISADAVELSAGNGLRLADYVIEVTGDYALRSELSDTYYPLTGNPSAFVTSTTLSSVSSTLSGAIDYVSANAGGINASSVILTGNNNKGKSFILEYQYVNDPGVEIKPGYIGVSGAKEEGLGDVVVELKNHLGVTTATHKLTEKLNATATAGFVSTATLNSVSSSLNNKVTYISGAVDYVSANGGKTYTGVAPIYVNNSTNQISADTWTLSAGAGVTFTDDMVNKVTVLSVNGGAGKTYTGVAPIQVDNVNDEISVACGLVSAGPGIDIVSDANGIMFSATNFYYSNTTPITATSAYSGLYIEKEFQQGKTTRTFYAAGEGVGELVPTGYNTGNYLTTTVAGMTWSPLPDYGAPVVLVATSGDIPASGSSDNKVYIVTGTV